MFDIAIKLKNLHIKTTVVAVVLAGFFIFLQCAHAVTATDPESLDTGFRHMYNLDFAAAHKTFEAWKELHPDDPLGAASNAAAYLFSEFERLHILDLDLFTDNDKISDLKLDPDPKLKAAFEAELAKADGIAAKILGQSSQDRGALFAKVLTDGLRGNYAALIEKQQKDGLNFWKSSRMTAARLIAIDRAYNDAYLAVGLENYVLGLRSAPVRWMLRLGGAQTSKDKGVAKLKVTAEKGRYLAPYARLLLAIAALREQDRNTAQKLLAELTLEFPQN